MIQLKYKGRCYFKTEDEFLSYIRHSDVKDLYYVVEGVNELITSIEDDYKTNNISISCIDGDNTNNNGGN